MYVKADIYEGLGEDFADGVEYARIGDGIRSRGAFNGGSIDDNDFIDRTDAFKSIEQLKPRFFLDVLVLSVANNKQH